MINSTKFKNEIFKFIKDNFTNCLLCAVAFAWLIFIFFKISYGGLPHKLNEFGDFVAGVFAPLALILVAIGYMRQSKNFENLEKIQNELIIANKRKVKSIIILKASEHFKAEESEDLVFFKFKIEVILNHLRNVEIVIDENADSIWHQEVGVEYKFPYILEGKQEEFCIHARKSKWKDVLNPKMKLIISYIDLEGFQQREVYSVAILNTQMGLIMNNSRSIKIEKLI